MEEISIWLDTYDDIYSDFDSRRFSKRMVSEDFIYELERNSKEMELKPFKIILLLPDHLRKAELESEIIESLKFFFRKQFDYFNRQIRRLVGRGWLMTAIGAGLLLIAAFILLKHYSRASLNVLQVILEPPSWFLIWNGLDNVFYESRALKEERAFYRKMLLGEIEFRSA